MENPNTNSSVDKEKGCIAGGLPLKAMRIAMENKGLLDKAGALYCGTGNVRTVEAVVKKLDKDGNVQKDDKGNEITETVLYDIPETIAVSPPSNGVQDGVTYGIKFTLSADNNKVVKSAVLVPVQPQ